LEDTVASNLSYLIKKAQKEEKQFPIFSQGRDWEPWQERGSSPTKLESEREALRLVHDAICNTAIVVEMQPVIVSRVTRSDGAVTLIYPHEIVEEGRP
jgi:hypothetical protein